MSKKTLSTISSIIPYKARRAYMVKQVRGAFHVMRAKLRRKGWVPASDVGTFDTQAQALTACRAKARKHAGLVGLRAKGGRPKTGRKAS